MKKYLIKKLRKVAGTDKIFAFQHTIYEEIKAHNKKIDEIKKTLLFQSTIKDSIWLKNKSFSPGRWAVDFSFLYTLYQVLEKIKPDKIVEFGLGESTKMISQYCEWRNVKAITFEHDKNWINFFKESFLLSSNVRICLTELEKGIYNGYKTLRYRGNISEQTGNNINLIILDGPFGSTNYSRSQIFDLIPKALNNTDFCIIIDDFNRQGEKETAEEVLNILKDHNIKTLSADYYGEKSHFLICSKNHEFLTSL
jgi:hypothetical protein